MPDFKLSPRTHNFALAGAALIGGLAFASTAATAASGAYYRAELASPTISRAATPRSNLVTSHGKPPRFARLAGGAPRLFDAFFCTTTDASNRLYQSC